MSNPGRYIHRIGVFRAFTIAAALVAVSLLLRLILYPWLGLTVPYLQFFPAILIAAHYGGRPAGIFATVLAALATAYFFLTPIGSLAVLGIADLVSLPLFIGVGLGIAEVI